LKFKATGSVGLAIDPAFEVGAPARVEFSGRLGWASATDDASAKPTIAIITSRDCNTPSRLRIDGARSHLRYRVSVNNLDSHANDVPTAFTRPNQIE